MSAKKSADKQHRSEKADDAAVDAALEDETVDPLPESGNGEEAERRPMQRRWLPSLRRKRTGCCGFRPKWRTCVAARHEKSPSSVATGRCR